MGVRFRKSVKMGPVKLNFGKTGVSTSVGHLNFSKRGVYANSSLPGTGLSWRTQLAGGQIPPDHPRAQTTTKKIPFCITAEDDGTVRWVDGMGKPLSEELIILARRQNRPAIIEMLEQACREINGKLDRLLSLHLETLQPDLQVTYIPAAFSVAPPPAPDPAYFSTPKPKEPDRAQQNALTAKIGFLNRAVEKENQRRAEQYQKELSQWEARQQELAAQLTRSREEFARWQAEKDIFERREALIKSYYEAGANASEETMQFLLEKHLGDIDWPLETSVSFEIRAGGTQVWLDVDLPEIEMMPSKTAHVNSTKCSITMTELSKSQQQKNYLTHIHAIGFRVIGEAFAVLPSVMEVVLSAYSQRASRQTGRIGNEYLYSVIVRRNEWKRIDFENLGGIEVVEAFDQFELRRRISKQSIITPVEPFAPEG